MPILVADGDGYWVLVISHPWFTMAYSLPTTYSVFYCRTVDRRGTGIPHAALKTAEDVLQPSPLNKHTHGPHYNYSHFDIFRNASDTLFVPFHFETAETKSGEAAGEERFSLKSFRVQTPRGPTNEGNRELAERFG